MEQSSRIKTIFVFLAIGIFALVVFGLIWFFFLGPETPVGLGWYLFSFAAGLTMIVLPCTLPLAFVIVPLSMGKGAAKGILIATSFGLGVAVTLSMYGIFAAILGEVAIGTLGAPLESVKNWLYFLAGAFAFLFALGEIGLVKYRMPSYTGAAPAFIQKKGDYLKAILLGLFLGNIGVGCPHPATPVILTRIAASGDVFYGWMLFFTHAIGRILPLILLALLAILGVNALTWLIARKDKIEKATGWGMVFVAGFILVLGLFTHDWWVYSGQHTLLESITQEERFIGIVSQKIGVAPPHEHGIPTGTGLFGLPLWLGNWALVFLWILPLWWYYRKKLKITRLRQGFGGQENQKSEIGDKEIEIEKRVAPYRFWLFISLTLLLALTFIWVLPDRFLNHTFPRKEHMTEVMPMMGDADHGEEAHEALYHEEGEIKSGLVINLNVTPAPVIAGFLARLDFFVNEKPGNIPVSADSLEIDHEKSMHVVGVRDDLEEFFHKHPAPTITPGILSFNHTFKKSGNYKVWSQVKKGGATHVLGHPIFTVAGDGEESKKDFFFGKNRITGNYQVSLKNKKIYKDQEGDLKLSIHDVFGKETELDNYLGAKMHVVIIKEDLSRFIHTHPEDDDHQSYLDYRDPRTSPCRSAPFRNFCDIAYIASQKLQGLYNLASSRFERDSAAGIAPRASPRSYARDYKLFNEASAHGGVDDEVATIGHKDTFNFHATFNETGNYKIFAEFRPKGANLQPDEALLAEFWIKVEEKSSPISSWWLNLLVSLVFIVVLSLGVRRFLRVGAK